MLILKTLSISNIGRFIEPQTIDFYQLGSLVQIDGKNNVTSGSSGAGKSTIFKALSWLLGLDGPSTTILQSRLTKEHIQVSALFDFDGQSLKIERGRKLLIELNGEIITGSSKISEEKLDSIIGMDRGLFSKILHKKQGSQGFFLEMGPTDVHKFLTKCLGLDKESEKVLSLDIRLDTLINQEGSLKSNLEANEAALNATKSAIDSLGEAPTSIIDAVSIAALMKEYLAACIGRKLVLETNEAQMDELEKQRPHFNAVPYNRSSIEELELQLNAIKFIRAETDRNEQNRRSDVKAKISELQILSSKLGNSELTRQGDVKNKISVIQLEISKVLGAEKDRQNQVQLQISKLRAELVKNQALSDLSTKAKIDASLLLNELQKVRSAVCPTCDQGWITDTCKAKESEILNKLSEHKATVKAGSEALLKVADIKLQIEALSLESAPRDVGMNELTDEATQLCLELAPKVVPEVIEISYQIEHLKKETLADMTFIAKCNELATEEFQVNASLIIERTAESDHQFTESTKQQTILANFEQKQTNLRTVHQIALQYAQDVEYKAKSAIDAAQYQMKAFEEALEKFEESNVRLIRQSTGYMKQIEVLSLSLKTAQEELELATESKKAIKSYLSCSFEDALESIGDAATKLIRNIPNMSTGSIQFDGLKENKDGKVKEEINAIISMDGEIGVPIKSLSGGERSSADLAIDLAVIEFIEERTGKGISVMALDEAFTGMDTVNISEVIEMLKSCNSNKQILIVDHNQISSQAIESRLTVVRDGQTSRIMQ